MSYMMQKLEKANVWNEDWLIVKKNKSSLIKFIKNENISFRCSGNSDTYTSEFPRKSELNASWELKKTLKMQN